MRTLTSWVSILLLISISTQIFAQDTKKGIHFFKGTWEEALSTATENSKPIFVDAYTSWCGPCKKMAKHVFTDPNVGQFFNKNYVNVKIDVEKGAGKDFAKKYKVNRYPTLLFINGEGEIIKKVIGFRKAPDLLAEGRAGLFDKKKLAALDKEYKEGKRDASFIQDYINMLFLAEAPNLQKISHDYLNSLSNEQVKEKANLEIIHMLATRITNLPFKLMMDNKAAFEKEYSPLAIQLKTLEAANKSLQSAVKNQDKKLFKQVLTVVENSKHEKAPELIYQSSLHYYEKTIDWKKYAKTAIKYLNSYEINDVNYLNNVAWKFYLHVNSKKKLAYAEQWIAKSISLKSNYHNNDTYAAILYKLGKKDEALQAAEKAIAIAKMERKDPKATKELLDKILMN